MTNQPTQSGDPSSNHRSWKETFAKVTPDTRIAAELRDADGHVLSKGEARFAPHSPHPEFFPLDKAALDTLRNHAKTLVLTDLKEFLEVATVGPCPQQVDQPEFHYHVAVLL
jgi:hypothetical protein